MNFKDVVEEIKKGNYAEKLVEKRFACAHCGNTWTELVGLVVIHGDENKELCMQIGMEKDGCRQCGSHARECQKCGSRDVYETSFANEFPEGVPTEYKGWATVSEY
jgi:hypothetical protein